MAEAEFPSNSRGHKTQPAEPAEPEGKKIERVVEGNVVRRKRPLHRRIVEAFIGGDAKGVWGFVALDVLLPAAKDTIADAGTQAIERLLFGESHSGRRRRRPGGSPSPFGHVAYNRYGSSSSSRDEPRHMSHQARVNHNFDEIILGSRAEAEEVLERLFDVISQYGSVSVADLYEMCNVSGNFVDRKWGWTDLRGARVTHLRHGWLLDLPKPEPLD